MKLQKKICMLGSFGVGKTSLVTQYVRSIFSEQYHTTIGVRIDQKQMSSDEFDLNLVLWDLAGEDKFEHVQSSYLMGASGFLMVVDGCRRASLDVAHSLMATHADRLRNLPFVCVVNKSDLRADWEIRTEDIEELKQQGWILCETSAKDGGSVEAAFQSLATQLIASHTARSKLEEMAC